jgi:hypothetical protein
MSISSTGLSLSGNISLLTSRLDDISTDEVDEGTSNLYYTDERVNTVINSKTSDDITEGITNQGPTDQIFTS